MKKFVIHVVIVLIIINMIQEQFIPISELANIYICQVLDDDGTLYYSSPPLNLDDPIPPNIQSKINSAKTGMVIR